MGGIILRKYLFLLKLFVVCFITLLSIIGVPKDASGATKKYGVLIGDKDNNYIRYDNLIVISPDSKIMVKAYTVCKLLDLSYSFDKEDKRITIKDVENNKSLVFLAGSNNYTYYLDDESQGIEKTAAYPCYYDKDSKSYLIDATALKQLLNYQYHETSAKDNYFKNGYKAMIVYSSYESRRDLPKEATSNGILVYQDEIMHWNKDDTYSIDLIIYAKNKTGKVLWKHSWKSIDDGESHLMRDYTLMDNCVYMGIGNELYSVNMISGKMLWSLTIQPEHAPIIDKEGILYCICKDGTAISAIYSDGSVKWTSDLNEIFADYFEEFGAFDIIIDGEFLYAYFSGYIHENCINIDKETGELLEVFHVNNASPSFLDASIVWDKVTASSYEGKYKPANVSDTKYGTVWAEGVKGYGVGEWIELRSKTKQRFNRISIENGFQTLYTEIHSQHGSVRIVKIEFSDGTSLIKHIGEWEGEIMLGRFVDSTFIKLTILATYPGDKYETTCISSIYAK